MKITIIGSSGGGKSTLARRISLRYSIPRLELDRLWFKYGGHTVMNGTDKEKAIVQKKIKADVVDFLKQNTHWVCDGTYGKIQPLIVEPADILVLIKRPLFHRVLSHLFRVLKQDARHPEVSRLEDIRFTKVIIRRWWNCENKKLSEFVTPYKDKLMILRSFSEADEFFDSLSKKYEKT